MSYFSLAECMEVLWGCKHMRRIGTIELKSEFKIHMPDVPRRSRIKQIQMVSCCGRPWRTKNETNKRGRRKNAIMPTQYLNVRFHFERTSTVNKALNGTTLPERSVPTTRLC